MSTELVAAAREKVELMRLQSGQMIFHRYTTLGGVRFVLEMVGDKEWAIIGLDDFTRAFHGRVTKDNRKKAKAQLRGLLSTLVDDGWRVAPQYEHRQLCGMIYALSIPEHDDQGLADSIRDSIAAAQQRRELSDVRLKQMLCNFHDILEDDQDDDDEDDEIPPVE